MSLACTASLWLRPKSFFLELFSTSSLAGCPARLVQFEPFSQVADFGLA